MSERTIATNAKARTSEFKLPELLAPVGGREQLVAAVNNGADAVYMGGSLFNARMKAVNFSDLKGAIDYAHSWGVKVYITLNTLIKDAELPKAFEYACSLYEMGADAVILQDMGLARLIHKYLPDFPMHLSTQGTVYNRSGVEMAAEMGFSRIVPARECTMDEISTMCEAEPEIEVFVHGALCMCYSGQCQMSRMLGGGSARSGNRGLCAQPCRLQYKDDKGRVSYALSPKDICTLDDLPALCEAGVDSFKIEGRLKSAEYVAVVTEIYRKYLDKFGALRARGEDINSFEIAPKDRRKLLQIFNRGGFTEGYLHGNPGAEILSGHSPKNQGIPVGKVTAITPVKTGRNADDKNRWLA
ncbi:MAG: peptidase U32 family protein, partial [Bacillota bacterium]|nr:peptidase U32 family protein [Bacillota bacterium]